MTGTSFDSGDTESPIDGLAADLRATMPELDVAAQVDLDAVRRRLFPDLATPQRLDVGRFVVHRRLGSGAMGIVFEAWDPKLDRKIALKVLRGPRADAQAAARLLREARALAQLRHPNVVAVHDVGVHDGQVFIAMDFVEGTTLSQWLQTPRRPVEILDLFVSAARGLAAAHEAGLVHRDFKPDNVLVTANAEPLVVDFGVARAQRDQDAAASPDPDPHPGEPELISNADTSMTRDGSLIGTPAYMAPEQLRRESADARSDQFAFAVALYEALLGRRPFAGATPEALLDAMHHGPPTAVAAGRACPRGIRKIIDRALCLDPADRYPSMLALLAEIEGTRRRRRRQRLALAGLAACALGAIAAVTVMPSAIEAPIACEAMDATMSGQWTDATKAKIEQAFAASGTPFAADAWERVRARLDDYTRQYADMQLDACEATHVRGQQSTATLELRLRCLDRRLAEVEGLLEVFGSADANTVALASDAAERLTPISVCANVEELQRIDRTSPLPEDPRERQRVEDLRRNLARLRSFHHAGRYEAGLAESRTLLDEALALGHDPSIADAGYRVGAFVAEGDPQAAEPQLETAFMHALSGGDDTIGATIAATSAHVIGIVLRRPDDGLRWARMAEALTERVGNPPELVGRNALLRGNAALLRGEYELGREAYGRAAAAFEAAGLEGDLGETLTNGAVLERRAGDHAAAIAAFDTAEQLLLRVFGPDHPRLATFANNRAALDILMKRWDAAEARLLRAITMMEQTSGPSHASLAHPLNNLGEVYAARDEHERALPRFERALEIWRAALGPDHPLVAHVLTQRALSLHAVGRDAQAERDADEALQIRERHRAPAAELAQTRYALALALPPDAHARARAHMQQALEELSGGEDPGLVAKITHWLEKS